MPGRIALLPREDRVRPIRIDGFAAIVAQPDMKGKSECQYVGIAKFRTPLRTISIAGSSIHKSKQMNIPKVTLKSVVKVE